MANQGRDKDPGHQAPLGETVVKISGLTKVFGDTRAVDGIDLEVMSGELVVLIGLSGAGKSTLLRCINGLAHPTEGTVEVFGLSPSDLGKRELRQLRRRVGFIFQHFGLVGRLTALGNVLAGSVGRVRGPRYDISSYSQEKRHEALEQLDRVGLARNAYQRADTLSGGEKQRVAIARTLFQQPEIVLADEPVASLDPESSEQVMEILFKVCREDNFTVLCSLHQVELALGWADRMVGLRNGKLVLDTPAHSLTSEEAMRVYSSDGALRASGRQRGTGTGPESNR